MSEPIRIFTTDGDTDNGCKYDYKFSHTKKVSATIYSSLSNVLILYL